MQLLFFLTMHGLIVEDDNHDVDDHHCNNDGWLDVKISISSVDVKIIATKVNSKD